MIFQNLAALAGARYLGFRFRQNSVAPGFFSSNRGCRQLLTGFVLIFFQNLAALAGAGGMSGMRPSFASTGMAGIPHAATGLSLQAAIANQAAYAGQLPAT